MMKTDKELLHLFLDSRSDRAFRKLVDRHIDWVYSVALRQVGGDAHLAEDVCQEVFASLAKKAKLLVEYDALNGWLFKATRFAASDMVRSERRRRSREAEMSAMETLESEGDGKLDWAAAGPLLDEAIAELDDEDRDALCLRFFEEWKFAQIGESLGLNENAARMRVNRALDKLSGILGRHGIRSSAAILAGVVGTHSLVSAPSGLSKAVTQAALGAGASSIGIVGTAKLVAYLASGVAAVAMGVAVYQAQELSHFEKLIAEQDDAVEEAERKGAELEQLLGKKTREADLAAKKASGLSESVPVATAVSEEEPVLDIMARYRQAQEWEKAGRLEDALKEYLWLFDNGVKERPSFSGLRSSGVLNSIFEIGKTIPEAKREIVTRRDQIEAQILKVSKEGDSAGLDISGWTRINDSLEEGERSLAVFDEVENESLKRSLKIFLKRQLVAEKRYEDAFVAASSGRGYSNFITMYDRMPAERYTGERRDAMIERNQSFALRMAVEDLELLAGAGQIDDAVKLAEEILVRDSSDKTVSLLQSHLERAGKGDFLSVLGK